MAEQTHLITLAVSGMTCGHCEIAVERLIRGCVGVESVRANHASALATLTSRGPLDLNALNAKMHDEGYAASLATKHDRTNLARSGVEAAGAIAVVLAIVLLARHFHLLPQGINVSENMTLGFVFVIGLVASVSSCMAVTGGLLVALAAKYNEATTNVSAARRFLPHVFFNAGRIIAYTGFGALIGLAGSALILSPLAAAIITIGASTMMIAIGLQMLGLLPSFARLLPVVPKAIAHRIHDLVAANSYSGAFTLGALTFFLP